MKKFLYTILYLIPLVLLIILILQIPKVKNIRDKIAELSQQLTTLREESESSLCILRNEIKDLSDSIQVISESMIESNEQDLVLFSMINERLMDILSSQSSQSKETKNLEKIYSDLLEEEQKKKVSDSEYDLNLEINRKKVRLLYQKKNYSDCYKLADDILFIENEDLEMRFYRMCSLFLINKMDSSNYEFIMDECEVLILNNYMVTEVLEIKNYIEEESISQ